MNEQVFRNLTIIALTFVGCLWVGYGLRIIFPWQTSFGLSILAVAAVYGYLTRTRRLR